jgi:hypothetical protein
MGVFGSVLFFGCSTSSSTEDGVNSSGKVEIDADDGRDHLDGFATNTDGYSVTPATSGPHWIGPTTPAGVPAPARWGVYSNELPNEVLVHNLEHGGIGIHYDCDSACPEIIAALETIVPSSPSQFIVSPYSGMPSKITITSWRHHLNLDEVDIEKIQQFIDEYKDRAPESVTGNMF